MPRLRTLAATAAVALTVGATATSAAVTVGPTATSTAVPGPRQPVEHLGISGANFHTRSGNPGCYTGSGSVGTGFAVPRGAMVTGVTLYVIDSSSTVSIHGELTHHSFTNGGSYLLGTATSTGTGTSTMDIVVDPGYVVAPGEAVNLVVTIGSGTCLKGAEVHFVRNPSAASTSAAGAASAAQPTEAAAQPTEARAVTPDAGPQR